MRRTTPALMLAGAVAALDPVAEGRDVGTVTVHRRPNGESLRTSPYSVPFAFAFRTFNPDAPIRHVE